MPPSPPQPWTTAGPLPCIRVELCWKIRILLLFVLTHVSFLQGRELRRGQRPPDCPHQTRGIQNSSRAAELQ